MRCRLELDHVVPLARGGPTTVSNLRVLCAAHNQLAARQEFGEEWMERFTSRARVANDTTVELRDKGKCQAF